MPTGFDRIARAYRWLEYLSFGRALERCRLARLPAMQVSRRALVLGDGDGRFTAALLAANAQVQVVAVDSSAAMLSLLAARVGKLGASGRLTVVHDEAVRLLESLPPKQASPAIGSQAPAAETWAEGGFDLVVTHFFLDCLSDDQVSRLAAGVYPRMASGAHWIISEFATPSSWSRALVALLYTGFAVLASLETQHLPHYQQALSTRGLSCLEEEHTLRGLLTSMLWVKAGPADQDA